MTTRKRTKGQKTIYKHTHKTNDRVTLTPLKPGVKSGVLEGYTDNYFNIIKLYEAIKPTTINETNMAI